MKNKSKFLSLVLRHKPELIGITLQHGGWVNVKDLLSRVQLQGHNITFEDLEILATDPVKVRFVFNDDQTKFRAAQGHSVKVDLGYHPKVPPAFLYHGTPNTSLGIIYKEGLKPMSRHAVHLSKDRETAKSVGGRRGAFTVLYIRALDMHNNGYKFYEADNGVWLTDYVPSNYIS